MDALGHDVTAFTMRRDEDKERGWKNIDLGRTYDAQMVHRALSIRHGIQQSKAHPRLAGMDLFWARNLDMLAIAVAARRDVKSHAPLVYETLDIHGTLTSGGLKGKLFRGAERRLLRQVDLIVVSSTAFVTNYYDRAHPGHPPTALIENVLQTGALPARPAQMTRASGPFRLGWVGILRCARTLDMLQHTANELGDKLEVVLHGKPALATVPDFHKVVDATPNMTYLGPYRSPDDLPHIYGALDAVWAGVTSDMDANARWLLPNRVYEGGYFGAPAMAIEGTETANFLKTHGTGEGVAEPLEDNLPATLRRWMAEGEAAKARARTLAAPATIFARGTEDLADALAMVAP